jgi:hypothetical protein
MRILFPLAFLALAACGAAETGPSLGRRPVEERGLDEPARTVLPPAAADAALAGRIGAIMERLRAGEAGFAALLPRVRSAAAAAGAEASESWIAAQQLLTALEGARGPSPAALSDLDVLITTRLAAGDQAGLRELEAARDEAAAVVSAQNEAIDAIRGRISR